MTENPVTLGRRFCTGGPLQLAQRGFLVIKLTNELHNYDIHLVQLF